MTFVNMERIEKRFNNQSVLRDVSLKMNRGEIVSIIGPSGSGKSTFLRCLGQLETIEALLPLMVRFLLVLKMGL